LAKGTTISLIDAAWIIYAINFLSGVDLVKLVGDGFSGKLNLKTQLTTGVSTTIKKLQTDPVNTVVMLGVTYLIKTWAHKVVGRKKIVDFGGLKVTL